MGYVGVMVNLGFVGVEYSYMTCMHAWEFES